MKNKRVALYIRVSTEEQARQGLSLDAQLADLRAYADKHKYKRRHERSRFPVEPLSNYLKILSRIKLTVSCSLSLIGGSGP